jgi:hypothetical protein
VNIAEYRVYKRTGFGGEESRPWRLVGINPIDPLASYLEFPGDYFDPLDSAGDYSRDTFYSVSVVDRQGRESALSGPGYLAYRKQAGKFAIAGDAGIISLTGDGPCQLLRWDGTLASQPFGVRAHRFPGYRPAFWGVAFGADRRLIVTDPANHVLALYEERGDLDDVWPRREAWPGFPSDEPGAFHTPLDVAVDGAGRIYVADFGNDRVQVLDALGAPIGLLDAEFPFRGPHALAYGNGHLCVTDLGGRRVRVYDVRNDAAAFVRELPSLLDADRALVSRTGKVYVTGRTAEKLDVGILIYAPDGDAAVFERAVHDVEMGQVYSPRGLYLYVNALDQDYGYCVNGFPFDLRRYMLE